MNFEELCNLGFDENLCRLVLMQGFTTNEEQVDWILQNMDFQEDNSSFLSLEYKMVIVIRSDLKMSAGKIAAQSVHAALGCVRDGQSSTKYSQIINNWCQTGEKVVCLKCENLEEIQNLLVKARNNQLLCHSVHDAGRTEVAAGSLTCIAIGPALVSEIDVVTGHLKVL